MKLTPYKTQKQISHKHKRTPAKADTQREAMSKGRKVKE
jgi:hypothetical protein